MLYILALVVIVIVYTGITCAYRINCINKTASNVSEEVQATQKAGYSLELPGLHADQSQNSFPLYVELLDSFSAISPEELVKLKPIGRQTNATRAAFEPLALVLGKYAKASSLEYFDYDVDQLKSKDYYLFWLPSMKNAAQVLAGRAVASAKEGLWEEAKLDLTASLRIAGHVGQSSFLITHLVQISILLRVLEAVQRVANFSTSREHLFSLRACLEEHFPLLSFAKSIKGEIRYGYAVANNRPVSAGTSLEKVKEFLNAMKSRSSSIYFALMPEQVRRDAELAAHLQTYREILQCVGGVPLLKAVASLTDLESKLLSSPNPSLQAVLSRNHNRFSQILQSELLVRVRFDATLVYLELLAFNFEYGHFPSSLAGLSVAAVDGFSPTSSLLKYRPGENGFSLYSVGPLNRDNGRPGLWTLLEPNPGFSYTK